MNVFSIVVDAPPYLQRQAHAFVRSLIALGGVDPDAIAVQCTSPVPKQFRSDIASLGVHVFDLAGPPTSAGVLNKMWQLRHEFVAASEVAVLCDCDLVFTAPTDFTGLAIAAKLVDIGLPDFNWWTQLLQRLGMAEAVGRPVPVQRATRTTHWNNLNGGLYVLQRDARAGLFDEWIGWAQMLLATRELLDPFLRHVDQIAFGLACASLGRTPSHLPERLNFPLFKPPPQHSIQDEPVVIHHHQDLSHGQLHLEAFGPPDAYPPVTDAVVRVNKVLAGSL